MTEYFEYITTEGQRFDQISYLAYGRSTLITQIIQANPDVEITDKLDGGIVLKIPVMDAVNIKTDASSLPPWKRDL